MGYTLAEYMLYEDGEYKGTFNSVELARMLGITRKNVSAYACAKILYKKKYFIKKIQTGEVKESDFEKEWNAARFRLNPRARRDADEGEGISETVEGH